MINDARPPCLKIFIIFPMVKIDPPPILCLIGYLKYPVYLIMSFDFKFEFSVLKSPINTILITKL